MNRISLSRRGLLIAGGALTIGPVFAREPWLKLYQARTIVTGKRDETRIPGLARCLAQVLVRVSGDLRLAQHPVLGALTRSPGVAVRNWSYRDLYASRPIRDEQGTRDRPYEMTVEYDPAKIDAILNGMGAKPWLTERPRLVVFLAVSHIGSRFMLTSLADQGDLMRQSFREAGWQAAMEVVIPSDRTITDAGLTVEGLPATPLAALMPLVDMTVGQVPIAGTLEWSKELLAWKAWWRLEGDGREHQWGIEGVNFDAAFRNGVGGATQILSGNGEPT